MENKYHWKELNHIQLGRYAEYFTKMEFTLYGFDVYTSEVDDKGIDFVIKKNSSTYFDIQVKSIRNNNYIFFPKSKFMPRSNLFAAVVVYLEGKPPELFIIPSTEWKKPNELLVEHNYIGKKSNPEWGLNISKRNLHILEKYKFEQIIGII